MKIKKLNNKIWNIKIGYIRSMQYIHFHCHNCINQPQPNILNITNIKNLDIFYNSDIRELEEILKSNLLTIILYNENCHNCSYFRITMCIDKLNEIFHIVNSFCNISNCNKITIYNIELIKIYGYFSIIKYDICAQYDWITRKLIWINQSTFLNSIKDGSILEVKNESTIFNSVKDGLILGSIFEESCHQTQKINDLTGKRYYVNLINSEIKSNYYHVKKFTMTKPAKNSSLSNLK